MSCDRWTTNCSASFSERPSRNFLIGSIVSVIPERRAQIQQTAASADGGLLIPITTVLVAVTLLPVILATRGATTGRPPTTPRAAWQSLTNSGLSVGALTPFDGLTARAAAAAVARTTGAVRGVAGAMAPTGSDWQQGDTALFEVIPDADGNSAAGRDTLTRVRAATLHLPGTPRYGGQAAESKDFVDAVYGSFPVMLALIIVITYLLPSTRRPIRAMELVERIFRTALNPELAGLALQFLLGMYINLYIADPHSQAVVVTHIILGFTLMLCAVITTATAVALRLRPDRQQRSRRRCSPARRHRGLRFLRHQHDGDSYLMAVGFLVATVTFASGAILNERRSRRGASAHELSYSSRARPAGRRSGGPRQAFREDLNSGDLKWEHGKAWAFEQSMGAVWYSLHSSPPRA